MQRSVTVPARGKREEFTFTYDAIPFEKAEASALQEAWLFFQDHKQTLEHTTAEKEANMLANTFKQSLKYLAKAIGIDKAIETLMAAGGFDSLTEDQVNEAIEEVKNPTPRKKRTPKAVAA
jgi:hypothetical protein